jgi:hypothetical protein
MNNLTALASLDDCAAELVRINHVIIAFGPAHDVVPFLTNYAIIKCCGTIEFCFKLIISDFHNALPSQAKSYIENTFTNSSMNPTKENICKSLKQFDSAWNTQFKALLDADPDSAQLESSLKSLNAARNAFAHGSNPGVSFNSAADYFRDARKIIVFLDTVVV